MHDRFIKRLSRGGPLNKVWLIHTAAGASVFGFFSIPSEGSAALLVPLFLTSSFMIFYGILVCPMRNSERTVRIVTVCGLGSMAVACWTRGIVLWGLDLGGAGSNILPTLVCVWISCGLVMLMVSTWARGVE